jgi:predicted AAA+ superfamily ATPase
MAQSNHERVGKALELLNSGLKPFVEREMLAKYGPRWQYEAVKSLREQHLSGDEEEVHLDTQGLLFILWDQWNLVFNKVLGHTERSIVSELRETRNKWAHQKAFSTDDVYRALDSVQRLLTSISAEEASEVERLKYEVLRVRFDEQTRNVTRKVAVAPIEGQPVGGLRPWREVVTPHPDVLSNRYEIGRFAANLGQVHRGEGEPEYLLPHEFFQRTYLTEGLRYLLIGALRRLTGSGGEAVIELQTNFGGGKTHSLLALYHLFSPGVSVSDLVGIESVLHSADVSTIPTVRRAVLVGYEISPGQTHEKDDGTVIHTMWGELAWQLLGKDGYALLAEADRQGVSPGSDVLRALFKLASPCLILIDEWVTYVRQLYEVPGLPGGSFDAGMSFAQALTEAARETPRALVVATLPSSDIEIGGEGGREALTRLRNVFGRLESAWRPANAEEGFEIVRRRLFQSITEPALFAARDAVAKTFAEFYRSQAQEFPAECRESEYERRIKAAYPIHPELFDRLYTDWSTLERFQRTRGVLRLMASVVRELWERPDSSLLILPASVPIDAQPVQFELTHYMEDPGPWMPVLEKDIDGPHSLPVRLDRENAANLGRYSACRRVARTIYMGSAPTLGNVNKGLTDSQIRLGCVQPGESIATFGDALRRLTDQSSHLYQNEKRYWYSTQPSVARLAQDRAAQLDEELVLEEIEKRLRPEQSARADFARVHICPASSADIADDDTAARLVILKPQYHHALRDHNSQACKTAKELLDARGNTRRSYRNTLVFLAADRNRLEELKQGARQYLAWNSINAEKESLNLDAFQRNQASTKLDEADKSVKARIPETYSWLLVPDQPDPKQPDDLQELKLQPQAQASLASNASRRLKMEEMLVTQYAGVLLRRELDRIPLWRGDHVSIKELADFFARYVYLPRLKNSDVLLDAIRNGVQSLVWQQETFAYADGWDIDRGRYLGLKAGQQIAVTLNNNAVLVKPEVAAVQMAASAAPMVPILPTQPMEPAQATTLKYGEMQEGRSPVVVESGLSAMPEMSVTPVAAVPTIPALPYHRFHGSAKISARMMAGDAGKINEEVVKHLTMILGANVQVTLEIHADIPSGVPDETVRTVTENCRTLKFEDFGFEVE